MIDIDNILAYIHGEWDHSKKKEILSNQENETEKELAELKSIYNSIGDIVDPQLSKNCDERFFNLIQCCPVKLFKMG